jgi:predicted DNA binding CopG/RHH family protein
MVNKNTQPDKNTFISQENEAKFWQKNFNQAWDQGKPTQMSVSRNLSSSLNIRFDDETLSIIRQTATKKGIGPTQLVRMWIKERLETSKLTTSTS